MTTRTWSARLRRFLSDEGEGGRGQALVEFAIAFPMQLFITFGIMQMILLYVSTLLVNYASYRATRCAIVGTDRDLTGDGTVNHDDMIENAHRAASIVLAPVTGRHIPVSALAESTKAEIPGWGELAFSDIAYAKSLVYEFEGDDPERDLTIVIEYDQELFFPVVDRMLHLVYSLDDEVRDEDEYAFGTMDTDFDDSNYMVRDPIYDPETKTFSAPRVRMIDGAYHLVIARECTMYRKWAANFSIGGEIDIGRQP